MDIAEAPTVVEELLLRHRGEIDGGLLSDELLELEAGVIAVAALEVDTRDGENMALENITGPLARKRNRRIPEIGRRSLGHGSIPGENLNAHRPLVDRCEPALRVDEEARGQRQLALAVDQLTLQVFKLPDEGLVGKAGGNSHPLEIPGELAGQLPYPRLVDPIAEAQAVDIEQQQVDPCC